MQRRLYGVKFGLGLTWVLHKQDFAFLAFLVQNVIQDGRVNLTFHCSISRFKRILIRSIRWVAEAQLAAAEPRRYIISLRYKNSIAIAALDLGVLDASGINLKGVLVMDNHALAAVMVIVFDFSR